MRILMVSAPYAPTPPLAYAGIERVVAWYVPELLRRGHDVTTVCVPGSTVPGKQLVWDPGDLAMHAHIREPVFGKWFVNHMLYDGSKYDIVHDNTHLKYPSMYCAQNHVPFLNTCHLPNPPFNQNAVALSVAHKATVSPTAEVIHLGVPVSQYIYEPKKGSHFLYLGYVAPHKRTHLAIQAARAAGVKLIVAGPNEFFKDYHNNEVVPLLDKKRIYVGEVGGFRKLYLLSSAKAILLPINWPEPGSTVAFEALASGTPVIGSAMGALLDIVTNSNIGKLIPVGPNELPEFIEAIKNPPTDYRACLAHVEENFSIESRIDKYLELYERVLSGETW